MTIGLSDWISCTASGSVAEREPYQIELIADTTLASRLLAFCTMCPRPRPRSFQNVPLLSTSLLANGLSVPSSCAVLCLALLYGAATRRCKLS